jgi:hypothetical protein
MRREKRVAVLTSPRDRTGERLGTSSTSSKVKPSFGRIFMRIPPR